MNYINTRTFIAIPLIIHTGSIYYLKGQKSFNKSQIYWFTTLHSYIYIGTLIFTLHKHINYKPIYGLGFKHLHVIKFMMETDLFIYS